MTNEDIMEKLDSFILGDMKKAMDEIVRLRVENEKLRKALEPFAEKYQDNGLTHSMYIFEMKHLLAAKKLLGETDE